MSETDPVAVVKEILEVYSGDMTAIFGDPQRLAEARAKTDPLFHPDVVAIMPASIGLESEMHGTDALANTWSEWLEVFNALSQTHGEPEPLPDGRVWVNTETVVSLSSGQDATLPGGSVWEVDDDGRVTWVCWAPSEAEVRELAGLDEETRTPPA